MNDEQKYPHNASEHATQLASSRGWHVFPCLGDKRPATPHGFQDASADSGTIARLWRDFPGPLIGIAAGAISGFDVLDLDLVKHQEAARFQTAQARWLAQVPRCVTRGGGDHYYFAHMAGMKCSVGRPVPGVDVRADGGYVIWWPVVRGISQASTWSIAETHALPPWPHELIIELRPPTPLLAAVPPFDPRFPGDITALLRFVEDAPVGQRNSVLHWAACRVGEKIRAGTIFRSVAERWLLASAEYAGLSQREAMATIRSGLDKTS